MPSVEKLFVFLASPGDVLAERRHVHEVVQELNRTVAADKGIVLDLVRWETHSVPGYGKDPQALINDQIAAMGGYALFIGIMWNRIGTPTPRAASGTVEEFERAAAAFKRKGQPEIWFYFKQASSNPTSEAQLEQKKEVLRFRKRLQRRGLTSDFTRPLEFRELLRVQLTLWLNKRSSARQGARAARRPTGAKATASIGGRATRPPAKGKLPAKAPAVAAASKVPGRSPRKTAPTAAPPGARARKVTSSGAWMMLDEHFFRTKSHSHRADGSISVRIAPRDAAEEAVLRSFQRDQARRQRPVLYAYQNDAGAVEVRSVESESTDGKTVFVLNLRLDERIQGNAPFEMSFEGYSADKLAEMRARLLLLNETPPNRRKPDVLSMVSDFVSSGSLKIKGGVFPALSRRLGSRSPEFLAKARLAAISALKESHTVEHVLELTLGPVRDDKVPVRFRGERKRAYDNAAATVIEFEGDCALAPSGT